MEKTITLEMTKGEAEQFEALLDQCIAAMDRSHEQMLKDQQDIERSKTRAQARLVEIRRILDVEKAL